MEELQYRLASPEVSEGTEAQNSLGLDDAIDVTTGSGGPNPNLTSATNLPPTESMTHASG